MRPKRLDKDSPKCLKQLKRIVTNLCLIGLIQGCFGNDNISEYEDNNNVSTGIIKIANASNEISKIANTTTKSVNTVLKAERNQSYTILHDTYLYKSYTKPLVKHIPIYKGIEVNISEIKNIDSSMWGEILIRGEKYYIPMGRLNNNDDKTLIKTSTYVETKEKPNGYKILIDKSDRTLKLLQAIGGVWKTIQESHIGLGGVAGAQEQLPLPKEQYLLIGIDDESKMSYGYRKSKISDNQIEDAIEKHGLEYLIEINGEGKITLIKEGQNNKELLGKNDIISIDNITIKIVKNDVVIIKQHHLDRKQMEGDGLTPTGRYYKAGINPSSSFGRDPDNPNKGLASIHISYPSGQDAFNGYQEGIIDSKDYLKVSKQAKKKRNTSQNTDLGSYIMIHGGGSSQDWTLGCIALEDRDMKTLHSAIKDFKGEVSIEITE